MHINGEGFHFLYEEILVGSLHEYCFLGIYIGTLMYNSTYIKWNYIIFYFINNMNTHRKYDLALFGCIYFYILTYPSQMIWAWMITNL